MTSAAERWRRQLEDWAIPQHLLDAVPDSPYGLPPELWKRRSAAADAAEEEAETTAIVRRLLPRGGALLDVGAGTGRASLPLAREGHRLTAVEKNDGMADGLVEAADGMDVTLVRGAWPDAAETVGTFDVAMCAHVVYDVQDIAPFVRALHDAARRGVVVELSPTHPWHGMAAYYRALHDLPRPDGPTAEEFADVVTEVAGVVPHIEWWSRQGGLRFESLDEIVDFLRKRLVLPAERRDELVDLVAPDVVEADGWLMLGSQSRDLVTVWWETVP